MFKLIENIFKGMCLWVYCMCFGTLKQRIISNFAFVLYRRNSFLNAT